MKVAVFDTKEYDKKSLEKYASIRNIEFKFLEPKLSEDTYKLADGCEGACVFVNDILNKKVIDDLYNIGVKAIFLRCAGFNNVDLKACFGKIHVYRVPAYSPYAVAEHAFALLLTSNRRIHKAYNRVRDYNFSLSELTGMDLHGKTVGVIGTGKIGKCFINIAQGFGMRVLAFDKFPSDIKDVKYVSLEELLKESDIISLHCPLTEDTYHLLNEETLKLTKKGVMIINTSRGALIDSQALLDAIKQRHVGAACLDVYEEEGDIFYADKSNHIMNDEILLQLIAMPNVLITSHQAFLTHEALDNIADTTTDNIIKFENSLPNDNEVCYHCGHEDTCKKNRKNCCFK